MSPPPVTPPEPFYSPGAALAPPQAGVRRAGDQRPLATPEPLYAAPAEPAVGDGVRLPAGTPPRRSSVRRPRPRQLPPQPATPSPFAQPDLWDTLSIAGVLFLGIVKVSGDPVGVDLDVTKSSGRDGSRVRDKGVKPAKVKLTIRIWDEETWVSWDALLPVIDPRRQVGRRTPVDAAHPSLSQRGISRLYIEAISLPDVKDDGSVEYTINAIEFMPTGTRPTGRTATAATRGTALSITGFRTAFVGTERAPANAPRPPSVANIDP